MTNPVKWIGNDGGWKVGEEVLKPDFTRVWFGTHHVLIREAHDGTLSWVDVNATSPYVVTPEFK
jgi:hypothetical protein